MSSLSVAGVVLIGGASRRMGADKARLLIDGRPMADRVGDALRAGGCVPVIGYGGDTTPSSPGDDGEPEILDLVVRPDRYPGQGPLGGVLGAFGECPGDVIVVVSCDLPLLDGGTVVRLVEAVRTPDGGGALPDVAVATTERRHHTCAAWARSAEPVLVDSFSGGTRALHRAIEALRSVEVVVDPRVVENVNTPDDLRRLGLDGAALHIPTHEAK